MRRRGYTPEAIRALLRAHRRRQARERRRRRPARALRPRGSEQARAARDGRAAAAQGRASRTIPRARSRRWTSSTTRRTRRPARARCRSRAMLYIEQRRLPEDPPKKFFRLAPGREVRLRYAYLITCRERRQGRRRRGRRAALHLRSGHARRRRARRPQGEGDAALGVGRARRRRRSAALRSAVHRRESPGTGDADFLTQLNPQSLEVLHGRASSSRRSRGAPPGTRFQFERLGYFAVDPDSTPARPCSTARSR